MTQPILGHIFGDDLNEIQFVCDAFEANGDAITVELGEILIIDDNKTKDRYLARVTNVKYGQKPEWMKEIARGYNRVANVSEFDDEHEETASIYRADRREQMYLAPQCELLGYISASSKFLTPKKLPSYFSPVRKPTEEDFKFLESYLGDIPFGNVRSGSTVVPVGAGLFGELLPKHIGVFAQTGGGKSNTMQVLIGSVMEQEGRYGMLLFEPHGEYIHTLKKHPYATSQLQCFSQDGKEGRQLRIAFSDLSVNSLMNIRNQMRWSEPQERFMREAESKFGDDWFRFIIETPVNMDEASMLGVPVMSVLKDEFPNTFEDTIKVTKSKLQGIQHAPYFDRTISDVDDIMSMLDEGKVVLIDMASLSGIQEILLSAILSNKVLSRRKAAYTRDREKFSKLPPVSIVLEEAQRVLGKDGDPGANVFAQICNEGRKFLTGLIAITQQPKLMDPVLISQFNTLIILSISDEKDFDILTGIAKKPLNKLRTEIRALMPGEAIITSPLSPFAMPVKIHLYDEYIKVVKARKPASVSTPKPSSFKGMV
jgi:hypothetical protein